MSDTDTKPRQHGSLLLSPEQACEVAAHLDATIELLPYLDELLADLWALGGNPEVVVDLLRNLDLEPGSTRVLDLACGKGAVAIAIARELGFAVDGVDLFAPFVEDAKRRAAAVGATCRFEIADLHQRLRPDPPYDIVVYAAAGALGSLDAAVGELGRTVRPGGYLVIDDGFIATAAMRRRDGYEHYATYETTLRRLESHGDRIVREVRPDPDEARRTNLENTAAIRHRAEGLCRRLPEMADSFRAYVARQEDECDALDRDFVGVVWLLERAV